MNRFIIFNSPVSMDCYFEISIDRNGLRTFVPVFPLVLYDLWMEFIPAPHDLWIEFIPVPSLF